MRIGFREMRVRSVPALTPPATDRPLRETGEGSYSSCQVTLYELCQCAGNKPRLKPGRNTDGIFSRVLRCQSLQSMV